MTTQRGGVQVVDNRHAIHVPRTHVAAVSEWVTSA